MPAFRRTSDELSASAAANGAQYGTETNYLRVHMAHVRAKLESDPSRPRYFVTEPGMGDRFEVTPP